MRISFELQQRSIETENKHDRHKNKQRKKEQNRTEKKRKEKKRKKKCDLILKTSSATKYSKKEL
jgi:hypothetical protein